MNSFKIVVCVVSLVCLNSTMYSADAAAGAIGELSACLQQVSASLPKFEQELHKQYPNPDDSQGREVHRLFNEAKSTLVPVIEDQLKLMREHPWTLTEKDSIFKGLVAQLPTMPPEKNDANKSYLYYVQMTQVYKQELDRRHPESTCTCAPLRPCKWLHKEYVQYMQPMQRLLQAAMVSQSKEPDLFVKFHAIADAVQANPGPSIKKAKVSSLS